MRISSGRTWHKNISLTNSNESAREFGAIKQGIRRFLSANSLFQSDVKCPRAATFCRRSHTGNKEKVQMQPFSSNYLCGFEVGKKSLFMLPTGVIQNLNCLSRHVAKSPVWWKVHKHGSPTQGTGEPERPSLRDLNPEQSGVHYPHSTTTERLDSILHPLPVMRLCSGSSAFALSPFRLRFVPNVCVPPFTRLLSGVVWVHLGSDSQIHSHSALPLGAVWDQRVQRIQQQVLHFYSLFHPWGPNQSERAKKAWWGGTNAFKVVRGVNELVNACA